MVLAAIGAFAVIVGFVALLLRRPSAVVPLAMVAMWAAMPSFVPAALPGGVLLHEPLLVVSAVYLGLRSRVPRRSLRGVAVLVAVVGWGVVSGLAAGWPPPRVATDARGLVSLVLVAWCAAHLAGLERRAARALTGILWWSAGLTVAAAVGVVRLSGRQETVAVFVHGTAVSGDATRFVSSATFPALAVACGAVGLVAAGQSSLWACRRVLVPSAAILVLSFSRNTVLGLAVAALFGFTALSTFRHLSRAAVQAVAAAAVVVVLAVGSPQLSGVPAVGFASRQIEGYSGRVVAGLGGEARQRDPSLIYREDETRDLKRSAGSVLGHGFGFRYRRVDGWVTEDLAYYGHDFYLWLAVKTGLVGLAGFAWFASPVLTRTRRRGPWALALGSAGCGLLAVSVVAPLPYSSGGGGATAVGAVVGLLSLSRVRRHVDA